MHTEIQIPNTLLCHILTSYQSSLKLPEVATCLKGKQEFLSLLSNFSLTVVVNHLWVVELSVHDVAANVSC